MNICNQIKLNLISNYNNFQIKDRIISTSLTLRNKIVMVAALIFCSIGVCFLLFKNCRLNPNKKIDVLNNSQSNGEKIKREVDRSKEKGEEVRPFKTPKTREFSGIEPKKERAGVNGLQTEKGATEKAPTEKSRNDLPKEGESRTKGPQEGITNTEVSKTKPPKPVEYFLPKSAEAPVIDEAAKAKIEAILFPPLATKHALKIMSANDFAKHYSNERDVRREVANLNKNSGVYDIDDRLKKELKGENKCQTLLAIKDQKIVGFLMGEIQKSVKIEEAGITADRFYVYHFKVHQNFSNEKNPKEKIETKLFFEAMRKTKDFAIMHFSYKYFYKEFDENGYGHLTSQSPFFTQLAKLLLERNAIDCGSRIETKENESCYWDGSEKENWMHQTYYVENFETT